MAAWLNRWGGGNILNLFRYRKSKGGIVKPLALEDAFNTIV